jgi:PAS domain S-box-containing protein
MILAASQCWLRDHHREECDLIGRNHYEVFPDLPARWKQLHRKCLAGESLAKEEDLWVQANGKRVWLRWSMSPWRDADGNIGGIMIFTEDITQRKESEESLRLFQSLTNQSEDTFEVIDPQTSRFLDVNQKGPVELGCTREEYLSQRVVDIDPTLNLSSWRRLAARIRARGSLRGEGIHRRKDGTTFPVEFNAKWVQLDRDYIVTVVRDITERKQAEERLARLNRAKAILAGIDHALVHASDRQNLMDEVCRVAVAQGGFKLAWFGLVAPDGTVQPVARAGVTAYLRGMQIVTRDDPRGQGAVGTAIRENRMVIIEDLCRDPRMIPWRDRLLRFRLNCLAAIPIKISDKVTAAFELYAPRANFFDADELELLTHVKDDLSYALTAMADADARKRAEAELRLSESQLSSFFDHAPIGLVWLSDRGTILRANQAQLELLGCRAENCLGQPFVKFCGEAAQGRELLLRLAARETVRNFPMTQRHRGRAVRHVLVAADPIWVNNQFEYYSVFLRDVTDRIQLEREILEISEQERRRLAQDLHDGLGQLLAGTTYLTSTVRQRLAAKYAPEASELGRIQEVMSEALAQTRSLARGLHPVDPDPGGLMAALEALAARTQQLFHVHCRFNCPQPVLIQNDTVATHLFRIAQEALTNAIKHGKASRIKIVLTQKLGRVYLAVRNNGAGMFPLQPKSAGLGLRIMHYRARMIRGSLSIRERANGGIRVVCSVPLSAENGTDEQPNYQTKNEKQKD